MLITRPSDKEASDLRRQPSEGQEAFHKRTPTSSIRSIMIIRWVTVGAHTPVKDMGVRKPFIDMYDGCTSVVKILQFSP
jgi:hypothetical protein